MWSLRVTTTASPLTADEQVQFLQEVAVTDLLTEAFAKAARLPSDEQDAFARWLLGELESERQWSRSFGTSQRQLADLAREAIEEDPRMLRPIAF